MARRGKKYKQIREKRDTKEYSLEDAIKKVKPLSYSKFTGSLELHIAITLPKDMDAKSVKGAVALPHSSGESSTRVYVFTSPDGAAKAKKAGADAAGLEDLIKEVQSGKINFDVAIATPDAMPKIAVLGKELGPKGLMPNPKTGTVTEDIEKTVAEYKKGKQTFATDEQGGIHVSVGSLDMEDEKLIENIKTVFTAVETAVGKQFAAVVRKLHLAPTMGPSVKFYYTAEQTA
jgi:large subunit ribosomal protein L1